MFDQFSRRVRAEARERRAAELDRLAAALQRDSDVLGLANAMKMLLLSKADNPAHADRAWARMSERPISWDLSPSVLDAYAAQTLDATKEV